MNRAAFKLAAALLLKDGEISLADIQALPFVNDEAAVVELVNSLLENYDASLETRRARASSHLPIAENVIVLKSFPHESRLARSERSSMMQRTH